MNGPVLLLFSLLAAGRVYAAELPAAAAKPAFRISGVALNSRNGSPIPFCRIFLLPAGDQAEGRRGRGFGNPGRTQDADTQADAHGRFQLEPAQAGAWRLLAEARGFRRQALDAHESFSAKVVLSAAVPTAAVTLRLDADSTLSGVVLDEAGEPVAQASVQAEAVAAADQTQRRAFSPTDDRGHYELSGLAPGDYRIRVQARPWYADHAAANARSGGQTSGTSPDPSLDMVYPVTWYPGAVDLAHAETLRLAGGESRQADLHLQALPASHLLIARDEAATAPVTGQPGQNRGPGYQLRRVPVGAENGFSGPVNISVQGMPGSWDYGGLEPGLYTLEKRTQDGDTEGGAMQIMVPAGGGPVDLASAVPLVALKIAFAGAEPDQSVAVTLTDEENGARYSTGGNGGFGGGFNGGGGFGQRRGRSAGGGPAQSEPALTDTSLKLEVPPHRFKVTVTSGGAAYVKGMQASGAQLVQQPAAGPLLTIADAAPGKQPPVLTLELADGRAQIDGHSSLGGHALEGAMVLAVPALLGQPGNFAEIRRAETNTDGSFTLGSLTPGAYIVVVLDHGWDVNWRDTATLTRYLAEGVPANLQPGATVKLTVPAVEP